MNSRSIAGELEKLKPGPSLRIDNGYTDHAQGVIGKISVAASPELLPKIPKSAFERG